MNNIVVAALYKFVTLENYIELQPKIKDYLTDQGIKGTILLAHEGINGTIAGSREGMDATLNFLRSHEPFADLEHKESFCDEMPFYRLKIRLKKEIVTLGQPEVDPNKIVGTYVKPEEWNALITDPDVVVVDTRNDYEYSIGTFKNAINPETTTFRQFPQFVADNMDLKKNKKVAMFCTGGIRCEKASAYMLQKGFEEVYHLEGGILKYLENISEENSLWEGDCFVFDNRVSVKQGLEEGNYDQCHGCRYPISESDKNTPEYEKGVSCPHCHKKLTEKRKQRSKERQQQIDLAAQRNQTHIGSVM